MFFFLIIISFITISSFRRCAVAPRGRPPNLANIARRAEAASARRATAEFVVKRRQTAEARRAVLPRRARRVAIAPRAVSTIDDVIARISASLSDESRP